MTSWGLGIHGRQNEKCGGVEILVKGDNILRISCLGFGVYAWVAWLSQSSCATSILTTQDKRTSTLPARQTYTTNGPMALTSENQPKSCRSTFLWPPVDPYPSTLNPTIPRHSPFRVQRANMQSSAVCVIPKTESVLIFAHVRSLLVSL